MSRSPVILHVPAVWWIGAYAVVVGILLLFLAFRLRRIHKGASPPAAATSRA